MENFDALGLRPELLRALAKLNFVTPTPIQAASIPLALEGRDILGTAQTGTGKTGAFGIPLISHLLNNPQDTALVMTPTRELAAQVIDMMNKMLGQKSPIRTALLIGGEAMPKQFRQLQAQPRLIVGTPGRINDHLERRSVKLDQTRFLVLDETDRMLDMGFGIQIDQILTYMPQKRQTLLFSATLPSNILKLSGKYMTDPVRVSTGTTNAPALRIKQETLHLAETEKYDELLTQFGQREGSIIVFVKTKFGADKMAKKLRVLGHAVDAIHGDLRQSQRDRVIRAFRNRENRILIATDVAARGLDIPHIEHVINFDLPQCPEDYIHRIGRTARAGAEGSAINLVTPQDGRKWAAIRRMLNPNEKNDEVVGRGSPKVTPFKKRSGKKSGGFKHEQKAEAKPFRKAEYKPARKAEYKAADKPEFKGQRAEFKGPRSEFKEHRSEHSGQKTESFKKPYKSADKPHSGTPRTEQKPAHKPKHKPMQGQKRSENPFHARRKRRAGTSKTAA